MLMFRGVSQIVFKIHPRSLTQLGVIPEGIQPVGVI